MFGFILAYCRLLHRQLAGVVQVTVTPSWCLAITFVQLLEEEEEIDFSVHEDLAHDLTEPQCVLSNVLNVHCALSHCADT